MPDTAKESPDPKLVKAVWLVAIMAAGVILYFAQDVLIPVAMAVFFTLLLTPAVDRLQSWGLRRGRSSSLVSQRSLARAFPTRRRSRPRAGTDHAPGQNPFRIRGRTSIAPRHRLA